MAKIEQAAFPAAATRDESWELFYLCCDMRTTVASIAGLVENKPLSAEVRQVVADAVSDLSSLLAN